MLILGCNVPAADVDDLQHRLLVRFLNNRAGADEADLLVSWGLIHHFPGGDSALTRDGQNLMRHWPHGKVKSCSP